MDKVFCGNGKEITGLYGNFYNVSLKLSELEKYVNEKWYVNVTISKMKNPDKWGNTMSVCINDFKPNTTTPNTTTPKSEDMF